MNVVTLPIGRPYETADYYANPGKYPLFKTAQIARELDGFDVGQYVAVWFYRSRYNAMTDRVEPIYIVKDRWGQRRYLWASALAEFGL